MVVSKGQQFRTVDGWEKLPFGMSHGDVADVAVGAGDLVYLLTRREPRVIVYDRDGNFIRSWGEDVFSQRPHAITVAADGSVFCVDETYHVVRKFNSSGEQTAVIGNLGHASDTGIDPSITDMHDRLASIRRGGPPFNLPTSVAVAPGGDLYVTDGYGNCRVHQFSHDGQVIRSWGEPGSDVGQFYAPHDLVVTDDERVIVCDRENERIQVFTLDGRFIEQWTDVQRPSALAIGADGVMYVTELPWYPGNGSFAQGRIDHLQHARVTVLDPKGRVLDRWGGTEPCAPGNFVAPHGIAVDSRGDVYVAEVTWSMAVRTGLVADDCHTFHKFSRVDSTGH